MDGKSKSKFRIAFEVLTFSIATATAAFYISDTMTGTPVFANALKVVGFCPAPVATVVGPTGATGETGAGADEAFLHNKPVTLAENDYFYISGTYISAS